MTERVIALVDGPAHAAGLCRQAGWAARRLGLPVEILHVLGRHEVTPQGDLPAALRLGARSVMTELTEVDAQHAQQAEARGRAVLEAGAAALRAEGVAHVTRLARGDVVEEVAGAAVVVMGKGDEGSPGPDLERVVRGARAPVLVAGQEWRPVRRVLLAFDGGVTATRAVNGIADSALFLGVQVRVLYAGADTPAARTMLEEAELTLRAADLRVTVEVAAGEPEALLQARMAGDGFDMLVMGAYGHSRIRTLILGSTTTAMIRTARVPVLLYH